MKKYGISLTEEEMKKLTTKCEMSDDELNAAAGGCFECEGYVCNENYDPERNCPTRL